MRAYLRCPTPREADRARRMNYAVRYLTTARNIALGRYFGFSLFATNKRPRRTSWRQARYSFTPKQIDHITPTSRFLSQRRALAEGEGGQTAERVPWLLENRQTTASQPASGKCGPLPTLAGGGNTRRSWLQIPREPLPPLPAHSSSTARNLQLPSLHPSRRFPAGNSSSAPETERNRVHSRRRADSFPVRGLHKTKMPFAQHQWFCAKRRQKWMHRF